MWVWLSWGTPLQRETLMTSIPSLSSFSVEIERGVVSLTTISLLFFDFLYIFNSKGTSPSDNGSSVLLDPLIKGRLTSPGESDLCSIVRDLLSSSSSVSEGIPANVLSVSSSSLCLVVEVSLSGVDVVSLNRNLSKMSPLSLGNCLLRFVLASPRLCP